MTLRGTFLVAWLLAGHALAAGCYVALINVPDANLAMLGLSALLAAAVVAAVAVTDATALLWLIPDTGFRTAFRRARRRGIPAVLLGVAVYAAVAVLAARLDAWHTAHTGEIDAWFIASANVTGTGWVHRTIEILVVVLQAFVAVSLALAAAGAALVRGLAGVATLGWMARGLSRFQLGLVALSMTVLVLAPWRAVAWRPSWLPPDRTEALFVGVKLGLVLVVAHFGWALMLFAAARGASCRSSDHRWVG